jgi:integrase
MQKPKLEVRPYRHRRKHKFVLDLRAFGRGRKFFKTRAEADAECLRQKTLLERHSREAIGLSQREMSDFITAKSKLAKYGKTISDAVTFIVDHEERIRRCNVKIRQLVEELIEAKRRDGKAPRYLESLRGYLGRFCQEFGDRLIATVTPEELDTWLRDLPYSPTSRLNYRQHIGVLFSYAKRRRMIDSNPIEFTARPKLIDKAPEIFTVDELRALLDAALRIEPDVVPMLAIGAFAGLRDSEIQQLEWSEVNQARGFVEVKAAKAKSARRRLVPIQPNLAAWLQHYSGLTGAVVPGADTQSALRRDRARNKLLRVRKAAGMTKWRKNGLRHSFCSYRLAATNNAHLVASELGHTTSQLVYQHYREVVTPEEAVRYWQIAPAAEAENVVAFSK